MAQPKPSAAQALYGHLPSAAREPSTQRQPKSLADAMWPGLSREAKAMQATRSARRDALLRDLRELNAKIRGSRR
jgi:hypothetical protein